MAKGFKDESRQQQYSIQFEKQDKYISAYFLKDKVKQIVIIVSTTQGKERQNKKFMIQKKIKNKNRK